MQLSHHHLEPTALRPAGRPRHHERGYVLVMFALLLVPMLLLAGLSIDVGSWYNRAANIRKAADAAALAGVIWLPDETGARNAALAAAARNGFTPGNGITIDVRPSQQSERRLQVTITDDRVGSFLWGNLGGQDIELTRTSYAEYILPVPLGSPRNFFGTGPLVASPNTELLYQSVNPFCTSKVQGDRHQSGWFDANAAHCAGTSNQGTTPPLTDYRAEGYELYIEAKSNRTANIEVLLYDARYNSASVNPAAPDERGTWARGTYANLAECPRSTTNVAAVSRDSSGYCLYNPSQRFTGPISYLSGSNYIDIQTGTTPLTTRVLPYRFTGGGPDSYLANTFEENYTYELWAENSPFTATDDVRVCQRTFQRNTAFELSYLGSTRWNKLCDIPTSWGNPGVDSRYILRVRNQGAGGSYTNRGNGSNQWGVVAKYSAGNLGNGLCDGRQQTHCPRVYGKEAISVYANTTQGTAQFFLAEIDKVHAGKRLILELWDPGEGGSSLRILQPSGAAWARKNMTWISYNNDGSVHLNGGAASDTVDVTNSKFNGKRLVITIDLNGYNPAATNQWWKIEYVFSDPNRPNVTDRTTWTARLQGDPVHLVEEY